jgi:hypothetical protein
MSDFWESVKKLAHYFRLQEQKFAPRYKDEIYIKDFNK